MMKKSKFFAFFLAAFVFFGCGTTSVDSSKNGADLSEETEVQIMMFDDWQYKGFGKEYPLWAEAALSDDVDMLKQYFPQISQNEMELDIQKSNGTNSDMCKRRAENNGYTEDEAWLLEETWVRINGEYQSLNEPYTYIKLFLKKNKNYE